MLVVHYSSLLDLVKAISNYFARNRMSFEFLSIVAVINEVAGVVLHDNIATINFNLTLSYTEGG